MINRVMDLQKLTVRSRFIPMSEVISVDEKTPMHDVLAFARKSHFTRMPVWEVENGKRRVSGLISLKRLLFEAEIDPAQLAEAYMKPALYMDEDKRLEDALQLLQKSGHRMAIVLGRDKKETGIICLEDILKVIFGEVRL